MITGIFNEIGHIWKISNVSSEKMSKCIAKVILLPDYENSMLARE